MALLNNNCKKHQGLLNKVRDVIASDIRDGPFLYPRYGVLSLIARRTPMIICDNESFFVKVSKTAFTDMTNIYITAPFFKSLAIEHAKGNGDLIFIILHNLSHMLYLHGHRMKEFPHEVANLAQDLSINTRLQLGFPSLNCSRKITLGYGFNEGDLKKYPLMSEEDIARELMREDDQSESNSEFSQSKLSKKIESSYTEKEDIGIDHIVDPIELSKIMREEGLDDAVNILKIPCTAENASLCANKQRILTIADVEKAFNMQAQTGDRIPGRHCLNYAKQIIEQLSEGKITWKAALQEVIYGDGMQYKYAADEPGDIYYYDPVDMNLTEPIYIGSNVPANPENTIIALVDTSRSVDNNELQQFYSEIVTMLDSESVFNEIIVMSADTALRGEPILLTRDNYLDFRQAIVANGRGGTKMVDAINQAILWAETHQKSVSALLYYTDLGDKPPSRKQLHTNLPPMLYITTASNFSDAFKKKVKSYANTVAIDYQVIDLDEEIHSITNRRNLIG
jgi:predicted metal-dependent peptidase